MCDSINLSGQQSKKCKSKKTSKYLRSEALDRQTVNKKSFSDRICDDLCEEILQYLSLEDKLKLEGVSKQFQRTVFKKHYNLNIETNNCVPNRKVKKIYKYLYIENTFISLKSLKILLKKCPNITSIELSEADGICNYNPVFRLITKYCNNLREIDFGENEINDKNIEELQRKFGPKIKFIHRLKDANNYNLFPNIESLNVSYDNGLKLVFPQLKLKKLIDLTLVLNRGEEHLVKTCVDSFPTLRYFHLQIWFENSKSIYSSLDCISNLRHLIYFGFTQFLGQNNKLFCDSLKRMTNKCQKLKRIECSFEVTSENSSITQLFSAFAAFPALKRLSLRFYRSYDMDSDINEVFPFEAFKSLSNITHLTLQFSHYFTFKFFKDIDIHLPKLQYLVFKGEITATSEELTQMADILSRLSRLRAISLVFTEELNYEEIELKIIEKCRKIKVIDISDNDYSHAD